MSRHKRGGYAPGASASKYRLDSVIEKAKKNQRERARANAQKILDQLVLRCDDCECTSAQRPVKLYKANNHYESDRSLCPACAIKHGLDWTAESASEVEASEPKTPANPATHFGQFS